MKTIENNILNLVGIVLSVIFILLLTFCQSKNKNAIQNIRFIPKEFHDVKYGFDKNEINICTPNGYDELFNEIKINAPKKIIYNTKSLDYKIVFPVVGYSMVSYKTARLNSDKVGIYIYFRNIDVDEWEMVKLENKPQNEYPAPEPEGVEISEPIENEANLASGGAFNINVADYLKTPLVNGIYEIYLASCGLESNHVDVEIVLEK